MTRVYWHGVFPDFSVQGVIVKRGTIRHEIHWDGATQTAMEHVGAVKSVSQHATCDCGRCGR